MKTSAIVALAALLGAAGVSLAAETERSGEEIVKQQCSKCHAADGGGSFVA